MTTLTPYQGDLLLDVLEACQNVHDLYEQKTEAEQTGTDEDVKETTALYDKCVEDAANLYGEAALYLPEELLDKVANSHLPEHLMIAKAEKPDLDHLAYD